MRALSKSSATPEAVSEKSFPFPFTPPPSFVVSSSISTGFSSLGDGLMMVFLLLRIPAAGEREKSLPDEDNLKLDARYELNVKNERINIGKS